MRQLENEMTRLMMQFCYHCEDAVHCQTEEQCRACLTNQLEEFEEEHELELKGNQYAF